MSKEDKLKLVASIFTDALRLNSTYQDLCSHYRLKAADPSYILPKKYIEDFSPDHSNTLIHLYWRYGDVCSEDFEFDTWWENYKYIVDLHMDFDYHILQHPVIDYTDRIKIDMKKAVALFHRLHNRFPHVDEFIEFFSDSLKDSLPLVHLVVDASLPDADLKSSFQTVLSGFRGSADKPSIHDLFFNIRFGHMQPRKWQKIVSLRNALDIYMDYEKGLRGFSIGYYDKLDQGYRKQDKMLDISSVDSGISRERARARKVIANIEHGVLAC
ncbi:MAG: hypothetical protein R6T98_07715 [Desulfatiglandales bacterium]